MSQHNVEIVRRAMEAVAREDWPGLAAFFSPECELHDFDLPDAEVYYGPEGLLDWVAHWGAAWESWSLHDLDFRPVGDDRVLLLWRFVAKGKGSGIELSRDDAIVFTLRDGKFARVEYYNDQQQALEAVGLRT